MDGLKIVIQGNYRDAKRPLKLKINLLTHQTLISFLLSITGPQVKK